MKKWKRRIQWKGISVKFSLKKLFSFLKVKKPTLAKKRRVKTSKGSFRPMKVVVLSKRRVAFLLVGVMLAAGTFYGFRDNLSIATRHVMEVMVQTNKLVPIYRVQTNEKKVAISFDACWGADKTDDLLAILKDNDDIKTTFFLTGFWLEKYPDMVKKIGEAGHEIGNHSFTHPHFNSLSEEQIKEEITKTHNLIHQLTGQSSILFRPPFGEYNNRVISTIEGLNYKVIQWDVDSLDWKPTTADAIAKRVTDHVSPGSIVLFHNNGEHTPEAIRIIIPQLVEDGYEIIPISQLIHKDNYYIDRHTGEQKVKE